MRRVLGPVGALAIVAAMSAGCGSGGTAGGGADTASTSTTKLTARDKAVKFTECMRQNGVRDFPDPDAKGDYTYGVSVSPAVFTGAVQACKALKPPGALSSKRTPKQQSATLRFAQCVRDHGVRDFPDPAQGQPVIDTTKIPSSNRAGGMTILNAATQACGGILRLSAGGQGSAGGRGG